MNRLRRFDIDPWSALCRAADAIGAEEEEPPDATDAGERLVGALCAGGDRLADRCANEITRKAV